MPDVFGLMVPYYGVLAVLTLLVGVAFRVAKTRTDPVIVRATSPEAAVTMVSGYVDGLTESRFAFPSGVFKLADTSNDVVGFDEVVYGTVGFQAILLNIKAPFTFARRAMRMVSGKSDTATVIRLVLLGVAVFIFILAVMMAMVLLVATIVEFLAKWALRSRIEAVVSQSPQEPQDTVIRFVLRGPCAILSRSSLIAAFMTPARPVVYSV